ncbi:MAG: TRAP transporter small permease subunit [Gammaproteobacteria bacterium]|nr:TRAP transporter small permease subunit [Gammaproteobacteria bacterium]
MLVYIAFADRLSAWFGKAFAWLILVMAIGVGYEVLVRYGFNSPTDWAFDLSYIMYGTLFMMGGAYTLSRGGHVRGDFIYRLWQPRTQARVEMVLYFLFFFPGVLALIVAGWKYAERSWRYLEVSVNSPAGIPIFQFKTVVVAAGILLLIQGIAQVFRCVICIRTGEWVLAAEDIEETEVQLRREAALEPGHFATGTAREDGHHVQEEIEELTKEQRS